ncbi:MAG: aminodeoxychorismate/anthranilate synthase component II [Chitinophagaceae bacterium]|nr:aminodeoxychorismate/anthranilate synthase component II [Chitinophagaceae bacterium]
MKVVVIDNYDSFTYNLVHLVRQIIHTEPDVFRNDEVNLENLQSYDKILLSPGPGIPEEAGLLLPIIQKYAPTKSILGVCLGHQAIAQVFGGQLLNLSDVYHGVATDIIVELREGRPVSSLFSGITSPFPAGRYHSWIVSRERFPDSLEITATDSQGRIMALQHKVFDVQGVQFHPESVLTPDGEIIMKNWLFQKEVD